MNFTRDPVVLSVVTPKEGCRILIRNSKGSEREDYFADAVELVSFEGAVFFRSTEKPKPFLIPASDFEILEVKETKMVLKSVSINKSIKISGGKQPPPPKPSNSIVEQNSNKPSSDESSKKRSRRSRRRPYIEEEKKNPLTKDVKNPETKEIKEHPIVNEEVTSSILKKLFPPPSTLIKEKLSHYKEQYPNPIKEDELLIEEETHDEDIVTKKPKAEKDVEKSTVQEPKTSEPKTPEPKILDISEEKEKKEQDIIKEEIKEHNEKVVDITESKKEEEQPKESKKDIEKKKIDEKDKKDEKDTGLENKD